MKRQISHFLHRLLPLLLCCITMTAQAATVDIKDAVPNGEVNGYPLFGVGSSITVSPSNGSFNKVMIDGIQVAYNQYTYWSSYTIDVSKYLDGDVHRLQLLRGTANYGICYFVVDAEEIDGVFYAINGESAMVLGAIPEIREAHILSKYTKDGVEYPVTGICNNAFYNRANLSVVSIPVGIQSIGSSAFEGCIQLSEITIPESVTSIGSSAFEGCIQLSEITIPESVTSIGSSAFKGCNALTVLNFNAKNCSWCGSSSSPAFPATISVLTLGDKVTVIPDYFLCQGSRIQSLTIPESVTEIGESAFIGCQRLKSLTIGAGVLTIGSRAFANVGSYTSYTIPKVLWLGNTPPAGMTGVNANVNYVANDQYGLSNQVVYQFLSSKFTVDGVVYVPVSPSERTCDVIDCVYDVSISDQTISNKVVNKGIQLSVKDINAYSFYDQDNVVKLLIRNDGYIGRYAFYDCDKIETLNIANQGDIDERAFYSCGNLETATISNNGNIGEAAFRDCTNLETVTIFNQGRIDADAFRSDSNLRNVTLGEKVTDIGRFAFASCGTLPEIVIPNSVKTMGESVFSGCSALANVTIGNKVSELQRSTFSGCSSLGQISIPNNIASIGDNVFSGCTSLSDVYIEDSDSGANESTSQSDILALGTNGGDPLFSDCPLDEVYIGRKLSYETSSAKGYSPFYRNTSLRTVEITDAETQIYDNEFYGCSNLKSLKIGNGVTSIGNWAFSGCSSLDYFSAGFHVETIGKEAFSDCIGLTKYYSYSAVPPVCGDQALDDINKWECTLYVPTRSSDEYKAAPQWKEFFFVDEMAAVLVAELQLNVSELTIAAGESWQLTAEVLPANATDKSLIWASSDTDVATVDATGLVRAISEGIATITVKSADGNSEAECTVTVSGEAGIGAITSDGSAPIEVYNLAGCKLSDSLEGLSPGVYIIKQGGRATKVVVQ